MAVALWVLHTCVFRSGCHDHAAARAHEPGARGCGKTTLLVLLVRHAGRQPISHRQRDGGGDPITFSIVFRTLCSSTGADNLHLLNNSVLRSRCSILAIGGGGTVSRYRRRPLAALPDAFWRRSRCRGDQVCCRCRCCTAAVVINMQRAGGPALKHLDEINLSSFPAVRNESRSGRRQHARSQAIPETAAVAPPPPRPTAGACCS